MFVTPALLFGTALVGLPIVLHLAMRRQPQRLDFPALRFVEARHEANRRRLRLHHLLLLALRCAAIGLLALALARPSIQGSGWLGGQEAPVAAALVFDTSPRMDYRQQEVTRLDQARQTAAWLLKQLPAESDVAVLGAEQTGPVFSVDRAAAKAAIERLHVAPRAPSVASLLEDAIRLLEQSDKKQKEVYLFSDLARSAWPAAATRSAGKVLAEAEAVQLYVIDVGVKNPVNAGLGEVRLSGEVLAKNSPVRISTEGTWLGSETELAVELFFLDEQGVPQKRGHVVAEPGGGGSRAIEFPPVALAEGTHQGYVRIVGGDGLAWDDIRYFTVELTAMPPVLVATRFPDRAVFFAEALAAGPSRLTTKTVPFEALAKETFADYAAVCLLDPPPLARDVWRRLLETVEEGGRCGIFLGAAARPAAALNSGLAGALLAAPLKRHWRQPTYLVTDPPSHPALARFRAVAGSVPWQAFPVDTYWQLGPLAAGAHVIASYATGHPAILERPVGRGLAITMTTPVSDPLNLTDREPWNVLPTAPEAWPFLLLMDGLASYLVGLHDQQRNYEVGEPVQIRLSTEQHPSMVLVETPEGDRLEQSVDPAAGAVVVSSVTTVGNYRVRCGRGQTQRTYGFSLNLSPAETRLERLSDTELTERIGGKRLRIARNIDQIDRDVNMGRVGRELYPYLIGLVALVVGLEHLVSNRFYRAVA